MFTDATTVFLCAPRKQQHRAFLFPDALSHYSQETLKDLQTNQLTRHENREGEFEFGVFSSDSRCVGVMAYAFVTHSGQHL
jgi:hypothetical protein